MADPLNITLSLASIDTGHAVFEPDQVLTHDHLNGVTSYLGDQDRLTRVELLGVGIVGGLRVRLGTNRILVGKGVGVTTDGDLLLLEKDTVFDRFKLYGPSAPKYAPLYSGETMRTAFELVAEGVVDAAAQPLSAFTAGALGDMAALLLMESYEADSDLCSGTDCDNLGRDCHNTRRLLLLSQDDAATLATAPASTTGGARNLPELSADRPFLTGSLTTVGAVNTLYANACASIHANLVAALAQLHARVPALTFEVFGFDPSTVWTPALNTIRGGFTATTAGWQYYYDFLKDMVETWNALREALLDYDCVLVPDLLAFPKHLLLGVVNNPSALRTPLTPSPLSPGRTALERAQFLTRKLNVLIGTFSLPATSPAPALVVTPGRSELWSIEDRAIPYYYAVKPQQPVNQWWSFTHKRRGTSNSITGYRVKDLGGNAAAQAPLDRQIGRWDFFRIEGHLGQDVDTVMNTLEAAIAARNLPFAVRAVLLHSDVTKIKRKPKTRYSDLHRLHKLVRSEIESEFTRVSALATTYRDRIKSAATAGEIPSDTANLAKADTFTSTISGAATRGLASLSKRTYTEARADKTWSTERDTAINAASAFKQQFGDVSRTDVVTAFDTSVVSIQKDWLGRIEVLLDDKEKKADERLLFQTFLKEHPGLDHAGGVLRGGTFVVVYDDGGRVVADFMLTYRTVEEVEAEPQEPTISYTPPATIADGLVLLKPLTVKFDDLKVDLRTEWTKDIDLQKSYLTFLQDNIDFLQTTKQIVVSPIVGVTNLSDIKENVARYHAENIGAAGSRVVRVKSLIQDPEIKPEMLNKLNRELDLAEKEVVTHVAEATQYIVTANIDLGRDQSGDVALKVVSEGIARVSTPENRTAIARELKVALDRAQSPTAKVAIQSLARVNNLRL